jgi:uncharacterized protein (TIGR03437 family)
MIRYITFYLAAAAIAAQSQTLTTLVTFNGTNGFGPIAPLIQGTDGNFYGTTGGAADGTGATIFKITPAGVFATLYTFPTLTNPVFLTSWTVQGLTQGTDGNFYGITQGGGDGDWGTVFKMTPGGTLTVLHSFTAPGGTSPMTSLIQATDGNFYGTDSEVVFKITPDGALTTIYDFTAEPDNAKPAAGLLQASDGNFYGTTGIGRINELGTVYKLTPSGVLTLLHVFGLVVPDGAGPQGGLIQAQDGNLYGTTQSSDTGKAWVYMVTPQGVLTPVYIFGKGPPDGDMPAGGLLQGVDGNFYGTTTYGGTGECTSFTTAGCGTIFRVTPSGTETILYNFGEHPMNGMFPDGLYPAAGLIQDAAGNFYGTTSGGGIAGDGTVFKFSLASPDAPAIAATGGVLNGASFQAGISAGSWITINGTNISTTTDIWNNSIVNGALPATLDGVSVMVGSQAAYIEYVSPTQINAIAPNVPAGSVPVTVTTANGTSQAAMAQLSAEQPAFFQWGTYVVATRQDFSLAVKAGTFAGTTTVPAKPGEVIILWGTGFGPTSPATPTGVETPSTATYNTATAVSVTVGGKTATVYGAALAPGYAGLYQVAIQIPSGLANGDYPVIATIDGASSPATTLITVLQ